MTPPCHFRAKWLPLAMLFATYSLAVLALAAALDLAADNQAMTMTLLVLGAAFFAWLAHVLTAASGRRAPDHELPSNAPTDDDSSFAETTTGWRSR